MPYSIFLSIIISLLIMIICCQSKNDNVTFGCVPSEKKALLKFKASFSDDPSKNRLSSWKNNVECCSWAGVECGNATGHVVGLHLSNKFVDEYGYPSLDGRLTSDTIDSSLLELKYLSYLDLSGNDFQRSLIPTFLGSMKQLQYLNLSYAEFSGIVPHQLGYLSSLRTLDLGEGAYSENHLIIDDATWAGNLSSLEYLDMSGINLSTKKDLIKVLNMLPSLVDLHLSGSRLDDTNLPLTNCLNKSVFLTNVQHLDLSLNSFGENSSFCFLHNLTSIKFLDLSHNSLPKKADWIYNLLWDKCHLKSLNLRDNEFYGDISGAFKNLSGCWGRNMESINFRYNKFDGHLPEDLGELNQLRELDVSGNMLSGPIPSSLGNLRVLTVLHLFDNQLSGEIPVFLGQLSNLESIDISFNAFQGRGTLSEAHFAKLSRLESFYIGGYNNGIKFNMGDDWVPTFQKLKYLSMDSVEINGRFPPWLQTQKSLQYLDLSNCNIRGTLPAWLDSLMNLTSLDLSNNHIEGPIIPELPSSLTSLDLSNNMITNPLPINIAHMMPLLKKIDLSRNFIRGSIPESLCQMKDLQFLDLL